MFLECSDGTLSGVATMIVRCDKLNVDFLLPDESLNCFGTLIVHDVEIWFVGPTGANNIVAATAWGAEVLFIEQGFVTLCHIFCMEFHTGVYVAVKMAINYTVGNTIYRN